MEDYMKRTALTLVVWTMVLIGLGLPAYVAAQDQEVIATVNGEEIYQSEIDFIMETFVMPQVQAQNPNQELPEAQKQQVEQNIINQLVTQKVLLQKAAELGITADEAQVDQRMEAIKAQQTDDIPEDQLRELIANEMVIQNLIQQEVIDNLTISDEEAQQYYDEQPEQFNEPEQVQASHILIKVAPDATQEEKDTAKEKIDEVLAKAQEGEDFGELAKEYSEGPSGAQGGDLGFFPRGSMVQPFEDVAFSLDIGEISDVVLTQFGYHIIKVTDKQAERKIPFEEAKERLKQGLLQQKTNQEVQTWVEQLREEATIEIME
ncbi:peptidylprolyl isomerase [candidate division KSB3 bacterium]|uniref:peptidylprolyl isomerase n=1 Tax=candidate division KSB3 bacterium TaxID=2044937 RepID=A0A9D5Q823_9BACT|nr:peptidylprolyl isomerase [candidate division KSB3 bacterium]MBD3326892.1 peptidylprolyl isomerase [candidate division KSB3 bacterium]